MSTPSLSTSQPKRLPGPSVPGWAQAITNLLPWRSEFDSLNYMRKAAQQYGRFYAIWLGGKPIYVISDPALVHEVLITRAAEFHKADLVKHAVGRFAGNGLFTNEGDFWRRQRKLAQPAFHYRRIEAYGATMVQQTLELLAGWASNTQRDMAEEMTALTLGIVNKTLFNVDVRDQSERIGALVTTILSATNDRINSYDPIWARIFRGKARREAAAIQELFATVEGIIAEHRRQNEDTGDLLSMLLAARDEEGNPMSEQQLRDEVITLFIAGHETTANTLAWSFYLVAQHPAVEERLLHELAQLSHLHGNPPGVGDLPHLPYSEQVVKEAMRLYPPAGGITRQPIHDIELGGYPIAQGSMITLSTYNLHHDPGFFPEPDRFDPERFTPENEAQLPKHAYLPFGGGPRVCIGNSFSMMEARLILLTVLQRYKLLLAPGQSVRAEQVFTLRPKGGLPMTVQKR